METGKARGAGTDLSGSSSSSSRGDGVSLRPCRTGSPAVRNWLGTRLHLRLRDQQGSGALTGSQWTVGTVVSDHFARDCQHQTDASNSQVRRGANAVSMSLAGGGDVTTEQLEEQFGSVEEARSWVAAVYDATENWMAAVQWNQGAEGSTQLHDAALSLCLDCTESVPAHTPHSTLYWNRLYHSKTDWLRPCRLIETLTDGTVRLEFRCDRREGNEQGQLKPADRLRQYLHECSDVHVDTLTHAQRLLLCENMQPKTGATATGMATDSSVLPGSTTVNARAVLNRGHRESAAVSNVNAACISAECSRLPAGTVVDAPLNASSALSLHVSPSESEQVALSTHSQLRVRAVIADHLGCELLHQPNSNLAS